MNQSADQATSLKPLYPEWPAPLLRGTTGALATTRTGGVSVAPYGDSQGQAGLNLGDHVADLPERVACNRQLLQSLVPARPVWLTQVHGVTVVDAATVSGVVEADASFTTRAGVACTVMTADCLPVLFRDTQARVVGAAHAGWRGLAAGILQNTVLAMRDAVRCGGHEQAGEEIAGQSAGQPVEIQAWLGPAIGAGCFEVGAEVVEAFAFLDCAPAFVLVPGSDGKYLADIYALARAALGTVGVTAVSGGQHCTVTDRQFYSYRRDRVTGRQASLIWL